jgi:hypothetical protein
METVHECPPKAPWNKGKIAGQKAPLKLKDIWAIRVRLQLNHRTRELALFDLGLDSKLRGCDLENLRVKDVCHGDRVSTRAIVMQKKPSHHTVYPPAVIRGVCGLAVLVTDFRCTADFRICHRET